MVWWKKYDEVILEWNFMKSRCHFWANTAYTYEKSEKLWFWNPKSHILVPTGVNLERFSIGFRGKSMNMSFLDENVWNPHDIFEQKCRTRVTKEKIDDFDWKSEKL